jgi:hypothetical protein
MIHLCIDVTEPMYLLQLRTEQLSHFPTTNNFRKEFTMNTLRVAMLTCLVALLVSFGALAQRLQSNGLSVWRPPLSKMTDVPPTVSTIDATNLAPTSATLNGTVNPNGSSTTVYFEYGTDYTLSPPNVITTASQPFGWGTSSLIATFNISSLTANTSYYYRVVAVNSAGIQRGSIVAFSTNVAVALISPNGGESWVVGSQHSITWTSTGVDAVMLEYTTDNGNNWMLIAPSTPGATGSFLWTVPAALSVHCKVRITDVNNGTHTDVTDRGFTIYQPTGLFTLTDNNLGIITMNGEFGCAWGDFNGDGYLDLFLPGVWYTNTLYRNDGGGHFVDVSNTMGIAGPFNSFALGAVWADFNGDGLLDFIITDGGLKLFRNAGSVFTDITAVSNLSTIDPATSLVQTAVGDYNNDGNLDIALAGAMGNALPILILRNDNGVFTDVAPAMGITQSLESWNPAWVDVNNDGYPDLWMPTIRTPGMGCKLFINQNGQLVASNPVATGIAAQSAIVSCWGDFNNDGYMDLFLIPFSSDNDGVAKLYRNNGDGTFTDVASSVGLNQAFTSARGAYWGDYNNDGRLDLLVGNWTGPQLLFRNDGDHFTEVGAETGAGFTGRFRSVLFVDYDNNGSLDIFYNEGPRNTIGAPKLLLHNAGNSNHWIGIVLKSIANNTSSIGSRVTIVSGSLKQIRDIQGGGGGITNGDLRALVGLGSLNSIDSVIVQWPMNKIGVFKNLKIDSYNILMELPVATTLPATAVALTSAALNGSVNPNNSAVTAYFEWGTDNALSNLQKTAPQALGWGSNNISVTATVSGLNASTTYYYRVVGENSAGVQRGSILSFKTEAATPPDQIQLVINQVNILIAGGILSTPQSQPLMQMLDNALKNLGKGNSSKALLGNFITKVKQDVQKNILSISQAQPLIDGATTAIEMIDGVNSPGISEIQVLSKEEVDGIDSPSEFRLRQNYPNPFNPTTTISFTLPVQSFVSLRVFDAAGKEVAVLLAEELSAGTYSKEWNAARLPSGVYFYRLQAGSFTETRKLILLR